MTLRDYMTSHPGQYMLAESHRPLTLDMLSDSMLREEVTVFRVGQDAGGRAKFHLYVRNIVHVATLIESAVASQVSQGEAHHGHGASGDAPAHQIGMPR
jgi:hypothetical protein